MIVHGAVWILLLAALLIGTVLLVRSARWGPRQHERPTALEIFDRRYARGEIDRDEYLRRKSDILESGATARPPEQ